MGLKKISHIGIAVKDLEAQKHFYEQVLGMELVGEEIVEEQQVRVAMFRVGDSRIELLMTTDPDGPIGRFISKRGEGIHHIAYAVDGHQFPDLSATNSRRAFDRRDTSVWRRWTSDRFCSPQGNLRCPDRAVPRDLGHDEIARPR